MGTGIKKVMVDLDGVLTDFDKQLAELLNKKLVRGWDFGNDPKIWKKIDDAGSRYWAHMDWMPDGKELWDFIKKLNPTVLTAPSRHSSCKAGKRVWVKKHLDDTPIIIDKKKYEHAKEGYILIDDREKNIKKWKEAGGIGILHKNTKSTIKKLKRIMEENDKEASQELWFSEDGIHWEQHFKTIKTGSIKINPYDVVVQEAVQELGSGLQGVDVIQLENSCPGDKLAWVTNSDLLKGRPGKEKVIHLCLKKIKDRFKQLFGKEYSATSHEDNVKMKEIVKEFLTNVVFPHEYVHIQQELKNQGEFGPSPEAEAERAEDWKAMEQFGIKRAMVERIDRIASQLETLGLIREAEELDIVANTIEKDASLENFYINIIKSVNKKDYPVGKIRELLNKAVTVLWPFPSNVDPIRGRAVAWKKALMKIVNTPAEILEIALALKLKSGELAEKTMPIDEWAEMTKMTAPEFIQYVDSSTDIQPPSSNNGNPLEIR